MMDVIGILSAASAVGDPTRLRMLLRLSGGALSVGQLARAVDIAQPSASYHLRRLRQAELVFATRVGRRTIVRRNERRWGPILAALGGAA
jgi:DNA-binding transcriptional ArsR family regulator